MRPEPHAHSIRSVRAKALPARQPACRPATIAPAGGPKAAPRRPRASDERRCPGGPRRLHRPPPGGRRQDGAHRRLPAQRGRRLRLGRRGGAALLDLARAGVGPRTGSSTPTGTATTPEGRPLPRAGVTAIAHVAAPGVLRRLAEGRAARSGRRRRRSPPGCCGRRCSSRGSSGWTSAGAPPASSPLPDTARIRPASSWSRTGSCSPGTPP